MIRRILNTAGIVIMVIIVLAALPMTVPKLLGYQIYDILTDSMEPEYMQGSVVYVKSIDPNLVQVGDVIAFSMGDGSDIIAVHRVITVDNEARAFETKGDNNEAQDVNPVGFQRLQGVVTGHIPYLGFLSQLLLYDWGIAIVILLFSITLLMWVVADILKKKEKMKKTNEREKQKEKS